jgi:hypothetical protein
MDTGETDIRDPKLNKSLNEGRGEEVHPVLIKAHRRNVIP